MSYSIEFIDQMVSNMATKLAILLLVPLIIIIPFGLIVSRYSQSNFAKQAYFILAVGFYLYWIWNCLLTAF